MNFCLLKGYYGSDEEFRSHLQRKKWIFAILIALGVFSIGVAYYIGVTEIAGAESAHISGFFSGIGCGEIGVSIASFIRIARFLKDNKKLHAERIKTEDERNRSIVQKSAIMTIFIMLFASYIGMLIAAFYSRLVMMTLWSVIMGFVVIYLICNLVIRKIM